ncbi:MAG TPA: hypothetical protein VJL59_12250 [Anaerolineales bacterium]|nr:hypothetical protein [Anaerolineales bacterium]
MGASLGASESAERLVLAAAIAAAAGCDQIGRLVAAAVRVGLHVVQRDIGGVRVVQIPETVQTRESIPQVDRQPQVAADADALILVPGPVFRRLPSGVHFFLLISLYYIVHDFPVNAQNASVVNFYALTQILTRGILATWKR